jgi:hypothetical protein
VIVALFIPFCIAVPKMTTVGVAVGVAVVAVGVADALAVGVADGVAVTVAVSVAVAVAVGVAVSVAVAVGVAVVVAVAVAVAVAEAVAVAVLVGVAVAVAVAVKVAVAVAVTVGVGVAVSVAVAVAVGTVPKATPLRVTDCDAVLPSSVTVNFPISVVPVALVSVVGLKVTETWQFLPAEIDDPHEFAITSNGGVALIEETSSAKMLGLVMVTVLAADTDPT